MSSNIKLKGRGVDRIIRSKVMLSPLAGVTDNIFRRLVRKWAPNSLLFTEMINATSLKKGFGAQKINQIDLEEGPVGVQIFDNRPHAVSEAAKEAEDSGAFLIDINMGCPVKKIAKKGGGSALIKDRKLAIELVKNVVKAVRVPVTVKTRLGWDSKEENIEEFLFKLQDAGATMITLHGRTRKQGFSGNSDWEMIGRLKKLMEIPVIANGDIKNPDDALECLKKTNADGVMIGRSVYKHPLRWSEIDQKVYGINTKPKSASDIIFSLMPYIETHLTNGGKSWDICKHLINLVEGIPKAKIWRNQISNKSIKNELNIEYLFKLTTELKEMGF